MSGRGPRLHMDWSDYLRDEAAKYRRLAETAEDPLVKQEFLDLAAVCEFSAGKFHRGPSLSRPSFGHLVSIQHFMLPSLLPRRFDCAAGAAHERQGVGAEPAETWLAHDHVAGRHKRAAALAFCPRAGAHRTDQARCRTSRRDAANRVARRRGRADKILALDARQERLIQPSGRHCQNALARRARLPGAQAGGRARTLRGARMAGLPPPRHAVHRSLWISGLRTGDDSPLRTWFRQAAHAIYPSRRLPTPRRPRSGLNVMSQTRSPPCIAY